MAWLEVMAYPLGTALALIGAGAVIGLFGRPRFALLLAAVGFAWIWAWSTPVFSDFVRESLEQRYPELPVDQVPRADLIVVLGGAMQHDAVQPYPGVSSAADRYWHAARLFNAGRADRIIVSGGRTPGRGLGLTEAAAAALFMRDLGVPDEALVLETDALTTRENAVNVARLLSQRRAPSLLLVTSALHMRRAEAAFRGVGLDPVPVATDFEVRPASSQRLRRWLPSAAALAASSRAFHEYVGFWVYRLRGWL
jgi:uncharacterized SAM-binding protein YcdF (DUF218 family)